MPKLRLKVHRSSSSAVSLSSSTRDGGDDDALQYGHSTVRSHSQSTPSPSPPSLPSQSQKQKQQRNKPVGSKQKAVSESADATYAKQNGGRSNRGHEDTHRHLRDESAHSEAGEDDENDGMKNDTQLIQVAIRCRPRKRRRRHERRQGADGWLKRRARYTGGDGDSNDDVSSSSSSDSDTGSGPSGGVIEYDFSTNRHHQHYRNDGHKPFLHNRGQKPSLYILAHAHAVGIGGSKRRFEFDFVFPPWIKQLEVYEQSVQQQITHVLQAHEHFRAPSHATIIAYGQTGTGKTYTMGMLTSIHDEVERGIIPRAISQIMDYAKGYNNRGGVSTKVSGGDYLVVSMSYLQIYLETIQDLLVFPMDGQPSASSSNGSSLYSNGGRRTKSGGDNSDLHVRQRQNQAFYVEGLSEYEVTSLDDVHVLLETAARNRILAATARNKTSSRSHTLLTISLKRLTRRRRSRRRENSISSSDDDSDNCDSSESDSDSEDSQEDDDEDGGNDDAYTISFVDLAGSERVDGTLHFLSSTRKRQELRIREAKFINKSLSALGSVIAALAQPKQQQKQRPSSVPTMLTKRSRKAAPAYQPPPPSSLSSSSSTQRHIRFRDSQLTKLLQSRLMTGRGRLLLIATVDDQVANLTETLSTLKFASQCRRVELRSPRSKVEAAAKKRKDSLLEQVFLEMKTTHEEREAALHREYQGRLQVLENQLQVIKNDVKAQQNGKLGSDSVQSACYAALCALADQTGTSNGDKKERHPAIASFQSEKDMISYVKELYMKVQKAIKVSTTGSQQLTSTSRSKLKTRFEGIHEASQRIGPVTSNVRKSSSLIVAPDALAKSEPTSTHLDLAPALEVRKEKGEEQTKPRHPEPEMTLARRLLAATQLLPSQEDEFQAIARLLLGTPEALKVYHTNSNEEVDTSFSQIDQVK